MDDCQATDQLLSFFKWEHVPPRLQEISRPFRGLALLICEQSDPSPERYNALRKLLESKDCAVRAALLTPELPPE